MTEPEIPQKIKWNCHPST